MENKDFDQFIKKSLEHLDGENHLPMDWSSMNEKLDAAALDEVVKGSLGNLNGAEFIPMNWSAMENKLDVAEAEADTELNPQLEDIYLDAVAYDHLRNLETPYNNTHWEMMSARLDEEAAYRRRVLFTKAMEVVIVLLLIWTANNYFSFKKSTSQIPSVADSNVKSTINHQNEVPLPNYLIAENAVTNENSTTVTDKTKSNLEQPNTPTDLGNRSETKTPATNAGAADASAIPNIPTQSNAESAYGNSPLSNFKLLPSLQRETFEEVTGLEITANVDEVENSILANRILVEISTLPSLTSEFLEMEDMNQSEKTIGSFLKKKKLRTHEIFFSMFGSGDLNVVHSDFYNQEIRQDDIYQRDRYGYGGGFSIGFQLKRLLIETGASYNFISYNQRQEATITGNLREGYVEEFWEDAELNMVQVPLNIQYGFFMKNNWRIYSLTGVSLNMSMQNNFNFQIEDKTPTTAGRSPNNSANDSKIANEALSYKGILEGGNIRKNSYLTANLGFGLERKFTYRWSLFVQPVYRHYLLFDGIGPNEDRIHSGSVSFGAKVKIR